MPFAFQNAPKPLLEAHSVTAHQLWVNNITFELLLLYVKKMEGITLTKTGCLI